MDKIKFNGGGQPIYLDDLQLLQDNTTQNLQYLLTALVGKNQEPYLLYPYTSTAELISEEENLASLTIHANAIVIGGEIIPFPEKTFLNTDFFPEKNADLYIIIQRQDTNTQTHEDGQDKPTRTTATATLTTQPDGAAEAYPMPQYSLIELIGKRFGLKLNENQK